MLIHGLARLTGPPRFWIYFIGPGIVFILDKVSCFSCLLKVYLTQQVARLLNSLLVYLINYLPLGTHLEVIN